MRFTHHDLKPFYAEPGDFIQRKSFELIEHCVHKEISCSMSSRRYQYKAGASIEQFLCTNLQGQRWGLRSFAAHLIRPGHPASNRSEFLLQQPDRIFLHKNHS